MKRGTRFVTFLSLAAFTKASLSYTLKLFVNHNNPGPTPPKPAGDGFLLFPLPYNCSYLRGLLVLESIDD